ncbi:MAG: two-component system, NtrC family, response regulator GlrR, partial [Acidobacteriota bacterium]|nr:two-component system, NtrC family, response regulator GlrR [Acidobacteriota bacterium]
MQKKILLVEDDAPLRRTMTMGLNMHDYDTEPCENGVNALKKMETFINNNIPLDGVIVDLRLPDIDGIKLVKIMRFKYPDIPIILITGFADRYNQEEIHNLQVNALMEKPFTPIELAEQLTKVLETRKASATADKGEKEKAVGASAYIILKVDEEMGFF